MGISYPHTEISEKNQLKIEYQIIKINRTTRGKTTPSRKSTPSILAIIFSIYILLIFTIVHTSIYHFSLSECIRQVLFHCSKLANRAHAWLRLVSLSPITSRDVMGLRCPQAFAWGQSTLSFLLIRIRNFLSTFSKPTIKTSMPSILVRIISTRKQSIIQ